MKNNLFCSLKRSHFLVLFLLCSSMAFASSLRQYSVKDGLSDPTVSSVYQDSNGLLWLGTNNGINTFDGLNFRNLVFNDATSPFAGSVIVDIFEAENDILWVLTNQGLFRMNHKKLKTEKFEGFNQDSKITYGLSNDIYAVKEDNFINYYVSANETFKKVPVRDLAFDSVMEIFVDNNNNLWVFTDDGNHRSFSISYEGSELKLTASNQFRHAEPLLWCFYNEGFVYFVDATLTFFEYNLASRTKYYIQDIREDVLKYGEISSIIKHKDDFFVGFANGGLLRIKNMPDQRNKYQLESISLKTGVLSLTTDRFQDIVWIGTNGQGVYMYFNEASSLEGVLSASLPNSVRSPLTSFYLDRNQTLWLATAGDGIMNMYDYDPEKDSGSRSEQFTSFNSYLGSNMVYDLEGSNRNIIWVGTDNGLNYYSYAERRLKNLMIVTDGVPQKKPLKLIRSICELNDTTLWITTAGEGVVKVRVAGTADTPVVAEAKRFTIGDGDADENQFTVAYKDDSNTVWFGTLGKGVYKMDSRSERMENIQFDKIEKSLLNNIYAIHKNNQGYWFGTGNGLANLNNNQKTVYNDQNGLPFKMINGILEDNSSNLWLTTNRGIVKFSLQRLTPHLCKQSGDEVIANFGEGAYYKDPVSHMLFFGGSNGYVTINETEFTHEDYTPEIQFTGLSIFGKQENIYDYLSGKRKSEVLKLGNDQNVFAVSFVANDFIDGGEYTYFYKLNEQSDNWVDNGTSNTAFFTYLNPGTYTLSTKYRNNVTGKESPAYNLKMRITPPFYKSVWAYLLYILLFAAIVYFARWFAVWQNKKQLERRFSEETNKVKLQFFASMASEVYSALTMIMNPAKKIVEMSESDQQLNTYTNVIRQNALKLDEFVRDISELRMLESGERTPQIQTLSVSEIADSIAESFINKTQAKNINYQIKIDSEIYWNSDNYCLKNIISNLLTYAFTHIETKGTIALELSADESNLQLVISGNGMNVDAKKLKELFDRKTVLEMLEARSKQGYSVRDELILANCAGMVNLLNGEVKVQESGEGVSFIVKLPQLVIENEEAVIIEDEKPLTVYTETKAPVMPVCKANADKMTIMLISNNASLVWLLADHFASKYNLDIQNDVAAIPELLKTNKYKLVISEAHLTDADGIELIKSIKQDQSNSQISCVILASENSLDERFRSMDAGVELYIEKPFDMEIIETEVERILKYKELQEQYTSSLNRKFELGDEAFATKDDKDFYDKMIAIIDANLTNPKLSVELVCNELGYTSQDFYTKLKEITSKTPNEIIREYRLSIVESLLISTSLPVDEIIEKSGFNNKTTFVKVFTQKFGMAPRNYREQHKRKILADIEKRK
ncbi:hybrid sensor histidine kinase/response regulator transcription factor [Bacteroides sp. 519]|uniref:hybrid sensor histidine kinase/response regulator transcription factor n=1 Tax=Bacteroides sp. 519 TaxID=2302937 RepID=UPI0013D52224|nr:hybrid sensor histidine kinase/response regulator transcription factor [Bacteroides sp. 519]NDV56966.1 hybrid sensor histidine kinase/response regulator [Bacteroides sp. 519]